MNEPEQVFPEQGWVAQGLGVSKCSIRANDPAVLDIWYAYDRQLDSGTESVRHLALRADVPEICFPGVYDLNGETDAENDISLRLEVSRNSPNGLDLMISKGGKVCARGLGMADPDDSTSIIVSWWTGDAQPYGVVKYAIRDEQTIGGFYISKMSPDDPGEDIAIGDTTGGFPGSYTLRSREVEGRTWGPHHWVLSQRGDIVDVTWSEYGKVFCLGLGIVDPDEENAFIATYVAV